MYYHNAIILSNKGCGGLRFEASSSKVVEYTGMYSVLNTQNATDVGCVYSLLNYGIFSCNNTP